MEIEIKLPDLSRVALEPGDKLLVRCPKRLTNYEAQKIREKLAEHFPGHDVIVATEGLELSVIRPAPTPVPVYDPTKGPLTPREWM